MTPGRCPLSPHDAKVEATSHNPRQLEVTCPACGRYNIAMHAIEELSDANSPYRGGEYVLAALARKESDAGKLIIIFQMNFGEYFSVKAPANTQDVLDNLLVWAADEAGSPSASVKLDPSLDYMVALARGVGELEQALAEGVHGGFLTRSGGAIQLLDEGRKRAAQVKSSR